MRVTAPSGNQNRWVTFAASFYCLIGMIGAFSRYINRNYLGAYVFTRLSSRLDKKYSSSSIWFLLLHNVEWHFSQLLDRAHNIFTRLSGRPSRMLSPPLMWFLLLRSVGWHFPQLLGRAHSGPDNVLRYYGDHWVHGLMTRADTMRKKLMFSFEVHATDLCTA